MEFSLISTQVLRPHGNADLNTSNVNSTNSVVLNVSRNFGKTTNNSELTMKTAGEKQYLIEEDSDKHKSKWISTSRGNDHKFRNENKLNTGINDGSFAEDVDKSKSSEFISIPSPDLFDAEDFEMDGDDDQLLSPVLANLNESLKTANQSLTTKSTDTTIQLECKNEISNQSNTDKTIQSQSKNDKLKANPTDDSLMNVTSTTLQGVVRRRKRSTKVARNLRRTPGKFFHQQDKESKEIDDTETDFAELCKIGNEDDNKNMVVQFS